MKRRVPRRNGMKNRCCPKGSPHHERHPVASRVGRSGVEPRERYQFQTVILLKKEEVGELKQKKSSVWRLRKERHAGEELAAGRG